ncbi:MAG TPA: CHAT domain-containing protein [Terriglobales bacterium]
MISGSVACNWRDRPEVAFTRANDQFLHGFLQQSQDQARSGFERYGKSSPEWQIKFRLLEAKAALWRGLYEDALQTLQSLPISSSSQQLQIPARSLASVAYIRLYRINEAEQSLRQAEALCATSPDVSCGEVIQARGLLANAQSQFPAARHSYEQSLAFARAHGDRFLESTSLLNIGVLLLAQGRFDESIDQSQAAFAAAETIDARIVELVTKGNIGWAAYRLGDSERALQMFVEAEKTASELGDFSDQENQLTNIGYIQMDGRSFDLARQSFQKALSLAEKIDSKEGIYDALRGLSRLSIQTTDPTAAVAYAERALAVAHESGNKVDELYPTLVLGQAAALRGDEVLATRYFSSVEGDDNCPAFLKWEVQHSLARLNEASQRFEVADRSYRSALATFEEAREEVRHQDHQLSFLTNGWRIYDDYVHFLLERGKTNDALRWADFSRARTLADGLGLLQKRSSNEPPPLNASDIARRAKGVVLFYWLGEQQSYLWTISPKSVTVVPLAPSAEIDAAVQRYRRAIQGPQDILESRNRDGLALFQMLVGPAIGSLQGDPNVFVVPDGSLNNLNFETLLVPEPKLHYWIEDATIVSASSLRVLAASEVLGKVGARRLLLVGDSVSPNAKYPPLPRAAAQVERVASHFSANERKVLEGKDATPAAYISSNPGQFSHIHFVAHGTASRLSPLDSAIILSRSSSADDSFKLYARDIVQHPLKADLVTISACYGVGERAYSGEGLVGLSWAFLRSGAHHVIAALWEATDASTLRLMDSFYDGLDDGETPQAALRAAKLSLIRDSRFQNAFYWAPFQLYVGS